ncbi:Met-10+ like-protein [Methanobrevibacter cuticularis]|uniref:tRNA(Phe) (4-demethylwyosine(37)-C(7)) aminocarboxypropyltransferase n=1 Tax=Methanobrevibacter cuticularis TaxID=47311 RepID=A0A166FHI8_9EURY|nr:class I SAM-dependent methyltransferase family protein [Methanobrevibacter cuticularis]KZX17680.1 Met-10+ like-protein [Methanobrevibacter cuticularis]
MKWKKIGKILIIDDKVRDLSSKDLNQLLIKHDVYTIAKVKNISGKMRQPEIEILAGNRTETIHKENGCFFKLDISKVMWSKGNTTERMRIANLVGDGETIVDMFAGIGYFSIPIAIHANPKKIFSIELNPDSYYYLKENIILNKINNKLKNKNNDSNIIEPILGDSNKVAPKLSADRILMGYVKTTHNFLDSAIECINKGGIIHYHETVPEKLMNDRPIARIKNAACGRDIEILNNKIIKKYSPGVVHIVVDAKIY